MNTLEKIDVEFLLDKINSKYGDKNMYCIFCKSKHYDSKVGIIHSYNCIILELRAEIKKENGEIRK